MSTESAITAPKSAEPANISELLKQYASGPIQFAGTDNALYERHLTFDTVVDLKNAGPRERFEAFARSVRDILSQRWVHTENTYRQQNPKRVYYLSMEFLIGRSLANNVTNLRLDPLAQQAVAQKNLNWLELVEQEPDAGLGNLAIVGSHSTNGVAAIHSELLRTMTVKDLAELFPERFNNKTNGVTPRRWLLLSNPALSSAISEAIGDGWITDLRQLSRLKPLADDNGFRAAFLQTKREAKSQFADWLRATAGQTVDPESLFDSQVKRVHEYKRQLLNALRVVVLYNRLRENPGLEMAPRTFFFAGKAAPAYRLAKLIIKFLNSLAGTIDGDPAVRGRLKVVFLPEYCVSLAERLIPASDVSNQISTAGYEASGTSNMKFMMNGALTIGTRDGATIEMAEEAGEDNFFLFGLAAEEVAGSRSWYSPHWHYEHEPETRAALDLIFSDHFSRNEPGVFAPLRDTLLTHGDHYMHLADLQSYLEADQRLVALYADRKAWARKAIFNVASSGKFSSDRTIAEYAADIWKAEPCPVP
jgi:glycogen phosphorylase